MRRLHAAGMFGLVFLGDSTIGQDYLHAFHCPIARLSGDRRGMDSLPRPSGSPLIWFKSTNRKGTELDRDVAQLLQAAFGEDNCMFYKRRSVPELPNGPSKAKCSGKNRFLRIEKAEKLCVPTSTEKQEAGDASLPRSGDEICISTLFLSGKLSNPSITSDVLEVVKNFVSGGLGSAVLVFNEGLHVHANGERARALFSFHCAHLSLDAMASKANSISSSRASSIKPTSVWSAGLTTLIFCFENESTKLPFIKFLTSKFFLQKLFIANL